MSGEYFCGYNQPETVQCGYYCIVAIGKTNVSVLFTQLEYIGPYIYGEKYQI